MAAVAKQLIVSVLVVSIVAAAVFSLGVNFIPKHADYECSDYRTKYINIDRYDGVQSCTVEFIRRSKENAEAHVKLFAEFWTLDRSIGWLSWCYVYDKRYKCVDLKLEYGAASGVTVRSDKNVQ